MHTWHRVLFDEMKFNGDSGHCWDGWTLLKHVDFLLLFWVCILKALELIVEALGCIFDVFLVPDGQMAVNGHRCPKRERFRTKKYQFLIPFGAPFLVKVVVLGIFLSG